VCFTLGLYTFFGAVTDMVAKSYLCIRHGVTEMNVYLSGCPYGTAGFIDPGLYDTRLTAEGKHVASTELLHALRAAHEEDPIDLVVSSPLTRALLTAELGLGSIEVIYSQSFPTAITAKRAQRCRTFPVEFHCGRVCRLPAPCRRSLLNGATCHPTRGARPQFWRLNSPLFFAPPRARRAHLSRIVSITYLYRYL